MSPRKECNLLMKNAKSPLLMQIHFELMDRGHDGQLAVTVQDAHISAFTYIAPSIFPDTSDTKLEESECTYSCTVQSAYARTHLLSGPGVGNPLNGHFHNTSRLFTSF